MCVFLKIPVFIKGHGCTLCLRVNDFWFERNLIIASCNGQVFVKTLFLAIEGDGDDLEHLLLNKGGDRFEICPPAKGKKVKNQKLKCPEEAEPEAVVAVAREAVEANRGAADPGAVVPGAAAIHAVRAR
jgi:hypothetical protein